MSAPNQLQPQSGANGAPNSDSPRGNTMFFGTKSDPGTAMLTQTVSVLEVGVYRGPHYYSHTPMIRIQIDLGRLEEFPTNRIPGFTDALLEMLPGVGRRRRPPNGPGRRPRRARGGGRPGARAHT